jgi:hypothetical protein
MDGCIKAYFDRQTAKIGKECNLRKKRIVFGVSVVAWIAITIWLNVLSQNVRFLPAPAGRYRGNVALFYFDVVWFLVWTVILSFISRKDPDIKRDAKFVALRIIIPITLLVPFGIGHGLSIIIGLSQAGCQFEVIILWIVGYSAIFIAGLVYTIRSIPKRGWKRTMSIGIPVFFVLGLIIGAFLGWPTGC